MLLRRYLFTLAFLLGCGPDDPAGSGEPSDDDEGGASARLDASTLDARAPVVAPDTTDSSVVRADAAGAPADASLEADARVEAEDAAQADAAPRDGEEIPVSQLPWVPTPSDESSPPPIARDAATTWCVPNVPRTNQVAPCLGELCFSGAQRYDQVELDAQLMYRCDGYSDIGTAPPCSAWYYAGQDAQSMRLELDRNVLATATAKELRDALRFVRGSSSYPLGGLPGMGFYGRAADVEQLTYVAGRLHVSGWAWVTHVGTAEITVPHWCSNDVPNLCPFDFCDYVRGDYEAVGWIHYDVEASVSTD